MTCPPPMDIAWDVHTLKSSMMITSNQEWSSISKVLIDYSYMCMIYERCVTIDDSRQDHTICVQMKAI